MTQSVAVRKATSAVPHAAPGIPQQIAAPIHETTAGTSILGHNDAAPFRSPTGQ
jgi:hypothetical protein